MLLSLFCGPGGLDLGFEQEAFDIGLAFDIRATSIATYNANRPHAPNGYVRDVASLNIDDLDKLYGDEFRPKGVIGGPPCQSFSVSNVHKRLDDQRSFLPSSYARLLSDLNNRFPVDFFVFENVKGLLSNKHAKEFSLFKKQFEHAGFNIFTLVLDAVDFGVPQFRERVFIIGLNKETFKNLSFDESNLIIDRKQKPVTVKDAIFDLPEPTFYSRNLSKSQISHHPNHWCMVPKSQKFFTDGMLTEGCARGRSFRTLSWSRPSPTVAYGHREVHVHPNCKRRLSVFEAMLLQGFPSNYELIGTLSDQITQVSEAVPPPLGRVLANAILKAGRYVTDSEKSYAVG